MAKIARFEDLEAWKKAREMTKAIYAVTSSGKFSRDFSLRDQMRSSAVSSMSNISEGFERGGDKEFRQFLAIARVQQERLKVSSMWPWMLVSFPGRSLKLFIILHRKRLV